MKMKKLFDRVAFKKAIEQCGLTKKEIAYEVGCNVSDISRYESGQSTPRQERLLKLVQLLGPSITGLSFNNNSHSKMKRFNQEEKKFLNWFRALPFYRQCRVVGFCEAVVSFGSSVDAEFAADVSEQLALEIPPPSEQSG